MPASARRQATDFEQFESERLDLGEHTVQRSLIGERTRQHDVVAAPVSLKGRERGAYRLAQAATETDLVTLRLRIAACTSCPGNDELYGDPS